MFGYVTPCKMELKIKDYEKFKAYYCGLCKSIKINYGNTPRFSLNYDMTFLAILLDSLYEVKCQFVKEHCILHPIRKKVIAVNNSALSYAAFCNTALTYYKLLDNVQDDNSVKSKVFSTFLKRYLNKISIPQKKLESLIQLKLNELYTLENNSNNISLDEFSHPFAELTAIILSSYDTNKYADNLYILGYNLGKWIYIIDAWDDLEKDIRKKKFNAINSSLNKDNLSYEDLSKSIKQRIEFVLVTCARQCFDALNKLPLTRNKDLLNNIIEFGLVEKIDKMFNANSKDNCDIHYN